MTHLRNTKFIISCPARSGSTMLLHLLRSNPAVLCHGEVFGGQRLGHVAGAYAVRRRKEEGVDEALHALARDDAKRFLYDIVFDAQGKAVCGFKFKTDEAFSEKCRHIQDMIRADTDIKVLQLRRRNILAQFISHQVVLKQTGVTLVMKEEDRPRVAPFQVDVREAVDYFEDVMAREARVATEYPEHRRLLVDYEDLVQEGHPVREAIQHFLGVPVGTLSTGTKKILKGNESLLENVGAVVEALRERGFGARAGDDPAPPALAAAQGT